MSVTMNILFVMADQFRLDALRHIGGYGRTTALDALAAAGMSFRRAVTTSPQCIPARFALASGLYPHQTGIWQNKGVTLSPSCWSWIQALANAGYHTSVFGKTHFHESLSTDLRDDRGVMRGYGLIDVDEIAGPRGSLTVKSAMTEQWQEHDLWDLYRADFADRFATKPWVARPSPLGVKFYYDTYVGRRALEYLSHYSRPDPWFCWVSFAGPHEPWDAPGMYNLLHPPADMPPSIRRNSETNPPKGLLADLFRSPRHSPPLSNDDIAAMRANYAGNVTLIDDQIGAIFDFLKHSGIYDKTLIIFTSDHGEMNGDHGLIYKSNFLASAVEIPLIVKPPQGLVGSEPKIVEPLVELIDVAATVLDYAGIDPPRWTRGRSLRCILEGAATLHRTYVVSEFKQHTMVETRSWKCEFDANDDMVLLLCRDCDPLEQVSLVDEPHLDGVKSLMRKLLGNHRSTTLGRHDIALS